MTDYHLVCDLLCFDVPLSFRMVNIRLINILILLTSLFSLMKAQEPELFNSLGESDLSDDEKREQLRWFPADQESDCEKEPNSELVF